MNPNQQIQQNTLIQRLEQIEIDSWEDMYAAGDEQSIRSCGLAIHSFDGTVASIASKIDVLALNRVIGVGSVADLSSEAYKKIIATYKEAGVGRFFFQTYTEPGSELAARLESHGLSHYNNWVKLHRNVQPFTNVRCDLDIRQIDRSDARAFAETVVTAFDWPDTLAGWLTCTVGRENWFHYVAFDKDKPAATASMYVKGKTAWIGLAATLPSHRGRGAQTGLTARRIDDAAKQGADLIAVETAEETAERSVPSFRNMRRCGFEVAYIRPNFIGKFK